MGTIRKLSRRASVSAASALLAAGGIALVTGGTAAAVTFVHCPANNLQTAINAASLNAMLIVDGTCVGNFTVPGGKSLTLDGPAILDGNHAGTTLNVQPTAKIKLISITVQNGTGAGIASGGNVTGDYLTIRGNQNASPGAGIANFGTMTLTNSTITGNLDRIGGGGFYNAGSGVATISSSTIDHNGGGSAGGGVINSQLATLTLVNSFVTNNTATRGGGVYNDSTGGTLTVKGSHINNNDQQGGAEGGGLWNDRSATVSSNEILGNTSTQGGGVFNTVNGNLALKSSSVIQNTATGGAGSGGGVRNFGTLTLPGTNVAGNTPDNCVGC